MFSLAARVGRLGGLRSAQPPLRGAPAKPSQDQSQEPKSRSKAQSKPRSGWLFGRLIASSCASAAVRTRLAKAVGLAKLSHAPGGLPRRSSLVARRGGMNLVLGHSRTLLVALWHVGVLPEWSCGAQGHIACDCVALKANTSPWASRLGRRLRVFCYADSSCERRSSGQLVWVRVANLLQREAVGRDYADGWVADGCAQDLCGPSRRAGALAYWEQGAD
jgi:hypothetical protein